MSCTENWVGKAREIATLYDSSIEEKVAYLRAASLEYELDDDYIWSPVFMVCGKRCYDIIEKTEFDPDYTRVATKNEDGTISFHLAFYNGGTCFSEMFNDAIEEMNKDIDNG